MTPSIDDSVAHNAPPDRVSSDPAGACDEPSDGASAAGVPAGPKASECVNETRATARLWWGVVAGLLVTVPLAWLLSYASTLPFFIGIFFFALFGIMIGAVVYRVAAPGRPYANWSVLVATSIIVLLGWSFTIVKEAGDFPADMADQASRRTRDIGDVTRREYQATIERQIREFLQRRYPPGGTLGYVWWVLDDGVMNKGRIKGVETSLHAPQRRYWWATRVVLSIGLLAFGVGSQVFLLRLAEDSPARTVDANP